MTKPKSVAVKKKQYYVVLKGDHGILWYEIESYLQSLEDFTDSIHKNGVYVGIGVTRTWFSPYTIVSVRELPVGLTGKQFTDMLARSGQA